MLLPSDVYPDPGTAGSHGSSAMHFFRSSHLIYLISVNSQNSPMRKLVFSSFCHWGNLDSEAWTWCWLHLQVTEMRPKTVTVRIPKPCQQSLHTSRIIQTHELARWILPWANLKSVYESLLSHRCYTSIYFYWKKIIDPHLSFPPLCTPPSPLSVCYTVLSFPLFFPYSRTYTLTHTGAHIFLWQFYLPKLELFVIF